MPPSKTSNQEDVGETRDLAVKESEKSPSVAMANSKETFFLRRQIAFLERSRRSVTTGIDSAEKLVRRRFHELLRQTGLRQARASGDRVTERRLREKAVRQFNTNVGCDEESTTPRSGELAVEDVFEAGVYDATRSVFTEEERLRTEMTLAQARLRTAALRWRRRRMSMSAPAGGERRARSASAAVNAAMDTRHRRAKSAYVRCIPADLFGVTTRIKYGGEDSSDDADEASPSNRSESNENGEPKTADEDESSCGESSSKKAGTIVPVPRKEPIPPSTSRHSSARVRQPLQLKNLPTPPQGTGTTNGTGITADRGGLCHPSAARAGTAARPVGKKPSLPTTVVGSGPNTVTITSLLELHRQREQTATYRPRLVSLCDKFPIWGGPSVQSDYYSSRTLGRWDGPARAFDPNDDGDVEWRRDLDGQKRRCITLKPLVSGGYGIDRFGSATVEGSAPVYRSRPNTSSRVSGGTLGSAGKSSRKISYHIV